MRIDHIAHVASSPRVRAAVARLSSARLTISPAEVFRAVVSICRSSSVIFLSAVKLRWTVVSDNPVCRAISVFEILLRAARERSSAATVLLRANM